MNRILLSVMVFAACISGAATIQAAPKQSAAKDAKPAKTSPAKDAAKKAAKEETKPTAKRLAPSYLHLLNRSGANDDERAKIEAVLRARTESLAVWNKTNAEAAKEIGKKLKAARSAKDTDAVDRLVEQRAKLMATREAIEQTHDAKVERMLTPPQRIQWTAGELYMAAMRKFSAAKLTDKQKAAADKLAVTHATALREAKSITPETYEATRDKLYKDITANVLTDAQKPGSKQSKPAAPTLDSSM